MLRSLLSYKSVEFYINWLFFLYPLFFTFIKSWSNGISFIICALSLIQIAKNLSLYFKSRGKSFWFIFGLLVMPFFCELIVQLSRDNIFLKSLDGPSRFLVGAVIFVYLSRSSNILEILTKFSLGCSCSLVLTLFFVLNFDEYFWSVRCATNLLCPNALAVYVLLLSFLSLRLFANGDSPRER